MRFVYRHFAFLGEESVWAAEATECAGEQGRFWDYHDILFAKGDYLRPNINEFNYNNLVGFARIIEIDEEQFATCMNERRYVDRVRADSEFAENNGISSTPTVFVNGERVGGVEFAPFRDAIEAALAAAQ